jgi:transcriptional regulator with XRE-family HTH domain
VGTLGHELATLRKKRRLSQAQVAEETGLSPATISRVESGAQTPSEDTVLRILDALNASSNARRTLLTMVDSPGQAESPQARFDRLAQRYAELASDYETVISRGEALTPLLDEITRMVEDITRRLDRIDQVIAERLPQGRRASR